MHEKTRDREKSITISRRQFIKATVLSAGAASALSTVNAVPVKAATTPSKLSLIVSGYKLDRTEALIDGRAQVEGCEIKFEASGIGDINTNVFSGPQTLDVTEIGLHPLCWPMPMKALEITRCCRFSRYASSGTKAYSSAPIAELKGLKTCEGKRWQPPAFPRPR